MKLGKVTGRIAMAKSAEELMGAQILQVEMEGSSLAALDRAGARPGDRVLVVMSQGAAMYSMQTPADAVVVAVLEN